MNKVIWFVLILIGSTPVLSETIKSENLVIILNYSDSKATYKFNSRTYSGNILRQFSEAHGSVPYKEVFLLVSQDTPLKHINNTRGIMGKVGFQRPRIFTFYSDKRLMNELTFGCNMIYTQEFKQIKLAYGGVGCKE